MTPTRVMVVDDHPMVAEGIEAILETYDDIDVIATVMHLDWAAKNAERQAD